MSKRFGVVVWGLACFFDHAAWAGTAYEIMAQNDSTGPLTVLIDGKTGCSADAGKHCMQSFANDAAVFSYSLAGAAPVAFKPGNPEVVEVCHIDSKGAHCLDTMGQPTN